MCSCNYKPLNESDVPWNMTYEDFCWDILCPECKESISALLLEPRCSTNDDDISIAAFAWIAFIITILKEIPKAWLALQLVCRSKMYRNKWNCALAKGSPFFIFVLVMKPNIIQDYENNYDSVRKQYGVVFIDFLF